MNTHIASAAEEQAAVVEDINRNVVNISNLANETSVGARSTETSMADMGEQVSLLRELVGGFKLGARGNSAFDFSAARSAHLAWMSRIRGHLDGTKPLDEAQVVSHRHCALGKWYYDEGMQEYGQNPAMRAIEKPHAELHNVIKRCVELKNAGKPQEAEELYRRLEPLSKEIVGLLTEVERAIAKPTNG